MFFSDEQTGIDLSDAYGERSRRNEKVRGLIRILDSYNEETKTTARKQTGSFYTPRPIVE